MLHQKEKERLRAYPTHQAVQPMGSTASITVLVATIITTAFIIIFSKRYICEHKQHKYTNR